MANPVVAGASMGLGAVGSIFGAMGAAQKADATSNMYMYKSAVAQANQQIAAKNAEYELALGGVQSERAGLAGGQLLGQMKVGQAASGLDVTSGSAARTRASQVAGIQTEEATIQSDAARRAYGFGVEGMNYASESQFDVMSAKNVQAAKGFEVASSLLGGATSVSDKWFKFSESGVPGFSGDSFSKSLSSIFGA